MTSTDSSIISAKHPLINKRVVIKQCKAEGFVKEYRERIWASYFVVKIEKPSVFRDKGELEYFFERQIEEIV